MMIYNNVYRVRSTVAVLIMTAMISACSGGGSDNSTTTGTTSSSSKASAASVTAPAFKITGEPQTTATLGSAYYFKPDITGTPHDTVTYSINGKPAWATLNATTGELKGTPTAAGMFNNIAITANDGESTASLKPFSIVVAAAATSAPLRVTLTWEAPTKNTDGSAIDNLAGFNIHYGVSATALNKVVKVGSNTARSYLFTDLTKGTTYYFSVAAVNAQDVEGDLSPVTSLAL